MFFVALVVLLVSNCAKAQLVDVPPTWGGDIFSRPRLTGDRGGLRDELGQKGIVFDADLLMTPQVVTSGGRSSGGSFWGNLDCTLNVDTQKLGLWPGGFFKFSADTGFGSNAFADAGTIVPVNTAALLPAPDDRTTALMNVSRGRFLSPQFVLSAGKYNLADAGVTEFYGDRVEVTIQRNLCPTGVTVIKVSLFILALTGPMRIYGKKILNELFMFHRQFTSFNWGPAALRAPPALDFPERKLSHFGLRAN